MEEYSFSDILNNGVKIRQLNGTTPYPNFVLKCDPFINIINQKDNGSNLDNFYGGSNEINTSKISNGHSPLIETKFTSTTHQKNGHTSSKITSAAAQNYYHLKKLFSRQQFNIPNNTNCTTTTLPSSSSPSTQQHCSITNGEGGGEPTPTCIFPFSTPNISQPPGCSLFDPKTYTTTLSKYQTEYFKAFFGIPSSFSENALNRLEDAAFATGGDSEEGSVNNNNKYIAVEDKSRIKTLTTTFANNESSNQNELISTTTTTTSNKEYSENNRDLLNIETNNSINLEMEITSSKSDRDDVHRSSIISHGKSVAVSRLQTCNWTSLKAKNKRRKTANPLQILSAVVVNEEDSDKWVKKDSSIIISNNSKEDDHHLKFDLKSMMHPTKRTKIFKSAKVSAAGLLSKRRNSPKVSSLKKVSSNLPVVVSTVSSLTNSGKISPITATTTTTSGMVECPKCDLVLGSSRSLGGHMTMMHSRNSCKTLKCPKCNWHYKYQETLEIHMKEKHPAPLNGSVTNACTYCASSDPHPRLARGENYSCGYKPYKCEICNYSTTTKGNLSIHMQSDKHANNVHEMRIINPDNSPGVAAITSVSADKLKKSTETLSSSSPSSIVDHTCGGDKLSSTENLSNDEIDKTMKKLFRTPLTPPNLLQSKLLVETSSTIKNYSSTPPPAAAAVAITTTMPKRACKNCGWETKTLKELRRHTIVCDKMEDHHSNATFERCADSCKDLEKTISTSVRESLQTSFNGSNTSFMNSGEYNGSALVLSNGTGLERDKKNGKSTAKIEHYSCTYCRNFTCQNPTTMITHLKIKHEIKLDPLLLNEEYSLFKEIFSGQTSFDNSSPPDIVTDDRRIILNTFRKNSLDYLRRENKQNLSQESSTIINYESIQTNNADSCTSSSKDLRNINTANEDDPFEFEESLLLQNANSSFDQSSISMLKFALTSSTNNMSSSCPQSSDTTNSTEKKDKKRLSFVGGCNETSTPIEFPINNLDFFNNQQYRSSGNEHISTFYDKYFGVVPPNMDSIKYAQSFADNILGINLLDTLANCSLKMAESHHNSTNMAPDEDNDDVRVKKAINLPLTTSSTSHSTNQQNVDDITLNYKRNDVGTSQDKSFKRFKKSNGIPLLKLKNLIKCPKCAMCFNKLSILQTHLTRVHFTEDKFMDFNKTSKRLLQNIQTPKISSSVKKGNKENRERDSSSENRSTLETLPFSYSASGPEENSFANYLSTLVFGKTKSETDLESAPVSIDHTNGISTTPATMSHQQQQMMFAALMYENMRKNSQRHYSTTYKNGAMFDGHPLANSANFLTSAGLTTAPATAAITPSPMSPRLAALEKFWDPSRPFKCPLCFESFTQKNILLVHFNSVSHLHKLKRSVAAFDSVEAATAQLIPLQYPSSSNESVAAPDKNNYSDITLKVDEHPSLSQDSTITCEKKELKNEQQHDDPSTNIDDGTNDAVEISKDKTAVAVSKNRRKQSVTVRYNKRLRNAATKIDSIVLPDEDNNSCSKVFNLGPRQKQHNLEQEESTDLNLIANNNKNSSENVPKPNLFDSALANIGIEMVKGYDITTSTDQRDVVVNKDQINSKSSKKIDEKICLVDGESNTEEKTKNSNKTLDYENHPFYSSSLNLQHFYPPYNNSSPFFNNHPMMMMMPPQLISKDKDLVNKNDFQQQQPPTTLQVPPQQPTYGYNNNYMTNNPLLLAAASTNMLYHPSLPPFSPYVPPPSPGFLFNCYQKFMADSFAAAAADSKNHQFNNNDTTITANSPADFIKNFPFPYNHVLPVSSEASMMTEDPQLFDRYHFLNERILDHSSFSDHFYKTKYKSSNNNMFQYYNPYPPFSGATAPFSHPDGTTTVSSPKTINNAHFDININNNRSLSEEVSQEACPDLNKVSDSNFSGYNNSNNNNNNKRARTRITDDQLKILRAHFDINNSPTEEQIKTMSEKSHLPSKVIKHWFRNTLFKERQRNKDSPYNFNNPPLTKLPSNNIFFEPCNNANDKINDQKPKDVGSKPSDEIPVPESNQIYSFQEDKISTPSDSTITTFNIKLEPLDPPPVASAAIAASIPYIKVENIELVNHEPCQGNDDIVKEDVELKLEQNSKSDNSHSIPPDNNHHNDYPHMKSLNVIKQSPPLPPPHHPSYLLNFLTRNFAGTNPPLPSDNNFGGASSYFDTNELLCSTAYGNNHSSGLTPADLAAAALAGNGRRANRTRFTDSQIKILQDYFEKNAYPKDDELDKLSKVLGLSPRVIVVWFQNARQKARKNLETSSYPFSKHNGSLLLPGYEDACGSATSTSWYGSQDGDENSDEEEELQKRKISQTHFSNNNNNSRSHDNNNNNNDDDDRDELTTHSDEINLKTCNKLIQSAQNIPEDATKTISLPTSNDNLLDEEDGTAGGNFHGMNKESISLLQKYYQSYYSKYIATRQASSSHEELQPNCHGENRHESGDEINHIGSSSPKVCCPADDKGSKTTEIVDPLLREDENKTSLEVRPPPSTSISPISTSPPPPLPSSYEEYAARLKNYYSYMRIMNNNNNDNNHPFIPPCISSSNLENVYQGMFHRQYHSLQLDDGTEESTEPAVDDSEDRGRQEVNDRGEDTTNSIIINHHNGHEQDDECENAMDEQQMDIMEQQQHYSVVNLSSPNFTMTGPTNSITSEDGITPTVSNFGNGSGNSKKRLRTNISPEQLLYLHRHYQTESNPSKLVMEKIAKDIGLKKRVVQVWFQNARARDKKSNVCFYKGGTLANTPSPNIISFSAATSTTTTTTTPTPKSTKRCPFCNMFFRARSLLELHVRIKHPSSYDEFLEILPPPPIPGVEENYSSTNTKYSNQQPTKRYRKIKHHININESSSINTTSKTASNDKFEMDELRPITNNINNGHSSDDTINQHMRTYYNKNYDLLKVLNFKNDANDYCLSKYLAASAMKRYQPRPSSSTSHGNDISEYNSIVPPSFKNNKSSSLCGGKSFSPPLDLRKSVSVTPNGLDDRSCHSSYLIPSSNTSCNNSSELSETIN